MRAAISDVLKKYESAKPSVEKLCEMVGDIKPRHYSIASSQVVVGERIDLLIVTVDWKDTEGEFFFLRWLCAVIHGVFDR